MVSACDLGFSSTSELASDLYIYWTTTVTAAQIVKINPRPSDLMLNRASCLYLALFCGFIITISLV